MKQQEEHYSLLVKPEKVLNMIDEGMKIPLL